ncbi:MAG TPA: hypothetical protein VEH49_03750 [Methylomirabilota bacterium]|nr:hypothetical protein [Methylomirabilota bacterium]
MTAIYKALLVVFLQTLILLSLQGKLLYDRATRPRVWVRTGNYDPELPIRGRYITLRLQVQAPWFTPGPQDNARDNVRLSVENGQLVATRSDEDTGLSISHWAGLRGRNADNAAPQAVYLDQIVDFFVPEHAIVPQTNATQEVWAEVTIPRKGRPRPIQLALKRGTEWRPLDLR